MRSIGWSGARVGREDRENAALVVVDWSEQMRLTREPDVARRPPTTADTEALGRALAADLGAGDLVVLDGPLAPVKTALTRGIAAGLGVEGRVTSPTSSSRESTGGPRPTAAPRRAVHVDAYRLNEAVASDAAWTCTPSSTRSTGHRSGVGRRRSRVGRGCGRHLAARHLRVRLRREPESDVRTAVWEWVSGPAVR